MLLKLLDKYLVNEMNENKKELFMRFAILLVIGSIIVFGASVFMTSLLSIQVTAVGLFWLLIGAFYAFKMNKVKEDSWQQSNDWKNMLPMVVAGFGFVVTVSGLFL